MSQVDNLHFLPQLFFLLFIIIQQFHYFVFRINYKHRVYINEILQLVMLFKQSILVKSYIIRPRIRTHIRGRRDITITKFDTGEVIVDPLPQPHWTLKAILGALRHPVVLVRDKVGNILAFPITHRVPYGMQKSFVFAGCDIHGRKTWRSKIGILIRPVNPGNTHDISTIPSTLSVDQMMRAQREFDQKGYDALKGRNPDIPDIKPVNASDIDPSS